MDNLSSFLESISQNSDFNAELSKRGGYITFSNSGRRGSIKSFQIGLDSILQTLKDILMHLDVFGDLVKYDETSWRDNGAAYTLSVLPGSDISPLSGKSFGMILRDAHTDRGRRFHVSSFPLHRGI